MNRRELAEWILGGPAAVRLQLQAHKYIWDPQTEGRAEGRPAAQRRTRLLHRRRDRAVGRIRAVRADDPLRTGPRASKSRRRAKWRAALGVARHLELEVPLSKIGGSALVGDGEIPKDRSARRDQGIPSTYVPARNTVFLSLALAWAEVLGAEAIVIGVNALDYSGYPDCRPEYLRAFEQLAALATRRASKAGRCEFSRRCCSCRRPTSSVAASSSASTTA